jgi:type 1 fimbriae regulatory protein FimE
MSPFTEAFMKALTQKEVIAVLRATESRRDRAMIVLAYRHGMRTSEVCGLKLADVDMKNGQVTVRRLKGSLKTTQPLSDLQGEPLLSEKKALRAWLAERGDHPSAYVFTSQKSGRINRSQFYRIFSAAAEAAGLSASKRHPHCLKHALGFNLVAAGVDLASIRIALGHKNIASTAIYAIPTDEQVGETVARALASL